MAADTSIALQVLASPAATVRRNSPSSDTRALLLRIDALRGVSCFDERLFRYYDDFELSLYLAPGAWSLTRPVHHSGCAASKGWQHLRYFVTSGILFFNRHGWRWI